MLAADTAAQIGDAPRAASLLPGWPGHSSAARAALLSRTISAGLQDRPTIDVNSWRSCAGWLEHTAHRPDGHLRAAAGTMCR